MNLSKIDIVEELKKLFKRGFIKSLRRDNTGIGYTLETELGIKENNEGEPDLVYKELPVELKSQRISASSRVTLMTKTPHWKPLKAKEIIEEFGYENGDGRPALKITIRTKGYEPNGFKLEIDKKANRLNIIQKDYKGVVAYFDIGELMDCIRKKLYENLLLVLTERKIIKGNEYFRYKKAILSTHLNEESFEKLLNEGLIVFEFRMHIKSGGIRDRGPAFRISRNHIHKLYAKEEVIFDGSKLSVE